MFDAGIRRRRTPLLLLTTTLVTVGMVGLLPTAEAQLTPDGDPTANVPITTDEETRLALLEMDDDGTLSRLEHFHGFDLTHWNEHTDDGRVRTAAFVTPSEIEALAELDVVVLETDALPTEEEAADQFLGAISEEEMDAARARQDREARELEVRLQAAGLQAADEDRADASTSSQDVPPPVDETDQLRVLRADTFTNYAGEFLSLEVRSLFSDANLGTDDRPDRLEVTYDDGASQTTRELTVFRDAGEYIYHRLSRPVRVTGTPEEVTIRLFERDGDADGDAETLLEELTVETSPWASYDSIGYPEGFERGFVSGYLDSVDSTEAIQELAAEYPDLAEIVEMPYQTNGYQRKAGALSGSMTGEIVNVESLDWGHEGGNDLAFEIRNDGTPDGDLEVSVGEITDLTDRDGEPVAGTRTGVIVDVATDAEGETTSTAIEVVAAINADDEASELVRAFTFRGNEGAGTVDATFGGVALDDGLNAPEGKIDRGPRTVYALRIGAVRDGSKTGVFAYSQEHAREWVTPVVAVETASRLLHNYGTDPDTTAYVDNLDIFIVPTVNPDGTDYSRYDYQFQRRNMTNHCDDVYSDVFARDAWGVDLNRNFTEYTVRDGYSGASLSCVSDIYAGPAELSEPETMNSSWLVDQNPNIRFSMNIHTHGGYFMWAPGTYIADGRVPAPRPDLGIEDYFFDVSETILGRIAEHRGTVIEPGRTGPIIDVLYSAAGNSADDFFYRGLEDGRPIYAWSFEAGANRYIGDSWQGVGGFFPDYTQEGFDQAMEFSNGLYGMFEEAYEFELDDAAPTTTPNVRGDVNYDGPADVFFDSDEAATIHYTVDGTEPTLESDTVDRRGARDSAAPIHIEETTTLRWFGVDAAGNAEEPQELTVYIQQDPPAGPGGPGEPGEPEPGQACEDVDGESFDDVPGDGPHGSNIGCVAGYGTSEGFADGTYRPADAVRRDQMTSFIARMLRVGGVDLPADAPDAFDDDDGGAHEAATDQLAAAGIVEGRGDRTFDPRGEVTRGQMASFIVRALEYALDTDLTADGGPFTDTAGSPHTANIDVAYDLGITTGRTDTEYAPNDAVRRDQMGSFIARTLDVMEASGLELTPVG